MKKRLDYIDIAKGILIILAVIGHIWQRGPLHNSIYAFHMPAFFVISGMLLCYTQSYRKDFRTFLFSKAFSYGIPFVFIEFLGCMTDILRFGVTLNIKGYLYNTLTLHYNDPNLWFLVDLFFVEILFVLVKKLVKRDWGIWIICGVLFLLSATLPGGNSYINTLRSIFRYFLFFTFGFYGRKLLSEWNLPAFAVSVAIVFVVAAVFGKQADTRLSIENLAFLASGLCGTYAVLQIRKASLPKKLGSFLNKTGQNTLTIYGTHHIIYAAVGVLLGITDYTTTPVWAGLIMLAVVALLEVPIIYIINRWLPFLAGKRRRKTAAF